MLPVLHRTLVGAAAILAVFACLFTPQPVSAHLFGGPPFLSINGQDAQTNSSYLSGPSFAMPQDFAPQKYLVNQPIHLKIALNLLPVPEDIARDSTFRWTWDDGQPETSDGATPSHTYTKIGSHMLVLEVMAPGESSFTVLDTVRIDVVPDLNYRTPTIEAGVVRDQFAAKKSIIYVAKPQVDPSTSVASLTWDFGDGATSTEESPSHAYSDNDYLHFTYVQMTDKNGFKAENGLTLTANKGVLALTPLTASGSAVLMVDRTGQTSNNATTGPSRWLIVGGLLLLVAVAALVGLAARSRRKPSPAPPPPSNLRGPI